MLLQAPKQGVFLLYAQGELHHLFKSLSELLIRHGAKCLVNKNFMSEDIQAPKDASAETQEILKELADEGFEINGQSPKVEEPIVEPKTETKIEPEKVEEKKPIEREPKFVPVSKHTEERHKRQEAERIAAEKDQKIKELEAQINSSQTKPKGEEIDDIREAAKKIAEKHGLDTEFISEFAETIVGIANKRNVLAKEIEQKLESFEQIRASNEAQAREQAQEKGFNSEFEKVIEEFPDLANKKNDLRQLAFSEDNINTSLRRLALEYIHDNTITPGKKTAEVPSQGRSNTEVMDFENITEEQMANMTYEQMDLYETWLAKNKK